MTMQESETRRGYAFGLFAFLVWVLFPFYWNELKHVDPIEILCHRVIWIIPVCFVLMYFQKSLPQISKAFSSPKVILALLLSTFVISVNWGLYIWSVANDLIVQASLGYFLNPIANVLAGLLIFQEKLRKWQWISVGFAVAGVVLSMIFAGVFPWIGVILACSFGIYGAVRKLIPVEAVPGMFVETLLLAPFAIGYLIWLESQGAMAFWQVDLYTDAFLMGAGFVTAIPLVAYVAASKRLPISTLGMLFYLVPFGLFVIATTHYGEEVTQGDMITFAFIWAALIIFTWERRVFARKNREVAL